MKAKPEANPPVYIRRGRVAEATYEDTPITEYQGNPLIEALPPILSKEQAKNLLARKPNYDKQQCLLPTHLRLHLLQGITKIFVPTETILRLEQQIGVMIRSGLVGRNPMKPSYWGVMEKRIQRIQTSSVIPKSEDEDELKAISLTIVGISGIGKSTTLERILLRLYPQIIIHKGYKGKRFSHIQLVHLHIDCPSNGSLKALCLNIVQAIDDLIGEDYYTFYGCESRTAETLIPVIARIASLHSLGLLVIDEIQNLSEAKSGGYKIMLNFFVKLINDVGIPIVLVGTYKAMDVLSGQLRQARRGCGPTDLIWKPMLNDNTWTRLVKVIWKYQFLHNPIYEPDEKIVKLLHYECQGITDFAIKLFILSQARVMSVAKSAEEETITTSIIKSVASDSLESARPMLNALKIAHKTGNWAELKRFEDIFIDLEQYINQAESQISTIELSSDLDSDVSATEETINQNSENSQKGSSTHPTPAETSKKSNCKQASKARSKASQPETVMESKFQKAVDRGAKRNLTPYEALKEAGFIKSAVAF